MDDVAAGPKVSIIIALYNGGPYIAELATELMALSMLDESEVILVDDGSTDGSSGALRELAAALPDGRYLSTESRVGVAMARNRGIAVALADYVWFVDCDDRFDPSILRSLYLAAISVDADIAVCRADLVSATGVWLRELDRVHSGCVVSGRQLLDAFLVGSINGYLWNKLLRRSLLAPDTFPPLSSQSDLVGLVGLLPRVSRAVLLDRTLYHHVVRPGSITSSRNPDLENLRVSQAAMARTLAAMGVRPDSPRARYFVTKVIRYSICNTGYRLSEPTVAVAAFREQARREIGLRDVISVSRFDPHAGAAVAMLRYAEPLYRRLITRRWRQLSRTYFAAA